jgi:microsomal dipeptidase-like Zn-dependent dipeptidase
MDSILCEAIRSRRLVEFLYEGGLRVVEPHMIAQNELGHSILSGWFVAGFSLHGTSGVA